MRFTKECLVDISGTTISTDNDVYAKFKYISCKLNYAIKFWPNITIRTIFLLIKVMKTTKNQNLSQNKTNASAGRLDTGP